MQSMAGRVAESRWGSRLLAAALVLLGLVSLAALAAPLGWPFELFAHFRAQYAAAALLLAPLLAWQRRPALALAALLLACWQGLPPARRALAAAPGACTGPAFTVASANLRYRNDEHARFVDWLRAHPADLLVVQEVTAEWAATLGTLADYPHRYLLVRPDPYGIGVLSRWPLESVTAVDYANDGLPSLSGVAVIAGRPVRFLGLHTHWPLLPALARARDLSLERAAGGLRTERLPAVLLGDLNLTPDAPAFARLLEQSGLRDAVVGPRWQPTWLAGFWPLALRIDHVLVSHGLCVDAAQVGPSIGSDHRPVVVRLRLDPADAGSGVAGRGP
jgi:endonuclease/exonuclease/phosphatase (EEP) superfamily protein YafD